MKKIIFILLLSISFYACEAQHFFDTYNTLAPTISTLRIAVYNETSEGGDVAVRADYYGNGDFILEAGVIRSLSDSDPGYDDAYFGVNDHDYELINRNFDRPFSNGDWYIRSYAISHIDTSYSEVVLISVGTGESPTIPTVQTATNNDIFDTTANIGGSVSYDGGATVTDYGICWDTSTGPTISDDTVSGTGTEEAFIGYLTGLTEDQLYYARAFATNSQGTGYGNEIEFTTTSGNPAYVDSGGLSTTTGISIDVTYPSTNNNDYLILIASVRDSSKYDMLSGWILVNSTEKNDLSTTWFRRIADGTETGSVTLTDGKSNDKSGIIYRYSNTNSMTPSGVTISKDATAGSYSGTTGTIHDLFSTFTILSSNNSVGFTGTGWVQDSQIQTANNGGWNYTNISYTFTSSGTATDMDFTHSSSNRSALSSRFENF